MSINNTMVVKDVENNEICSHNTFNLLPYMLENKELNMNYKKNIKFNITTVIKRIFDIVCSVLGIIFLSPLFLVVSILIKLDSKGPVFFKHKRIGRNGNTIKILKFRTMVNNAEELLENLSDDVKKEYEENYKLENDFRITKFGKFLRKTSLDELPQLVNILIGDMSVVGPRPIVEKELEKFGDNKAKLLSVFPGLTGYWAANGRSNTTYEQRIDMEMYYVDNYSIWLDIKILFRTVISVLKRDGAK